MSIIIARGEAAGGVAVASRRVSAAAYRSVVNIVMAFSQHQKYQWHHQQRKPAYESESGIGEKRSARA